MKIIHCPQGSKPWAEAKKGIVSASNASRILTSQGKPSTSIKGYQYELIAERLIPAADYWLDDYQSPAMIAGSQMEREARAYYAMETGADVQEVGFCVADDGSCGCLPDGLVGDDGGLELKCPMVKTQVEYLDAGRVPLAYVPQVHLSLVVTGRAWWDFLSYAPFCRPLLIRVYPDDYTKALAAAVEKFNRDLEDMYARIIAPNESRTQDDVKELLYTSPF